MTRPSHARLHGSADALGASPSVVVARPPIGRILGFDKPEQSAMVFPMKEMPAMKTQYTVTEVAQEFGVTVATVREWIDKQKLIAIQPAGAGGAYRIPARALDVFRSKSTEIRGHRGRPSVSGRPMRAENIYAERIAPVLAATGMAADDLLRRMMTDMSLVSRYPSFASDYSTFVAEAVRHTTAAESAVARTVDA